MEDIRFHLLINHFPIVGAIFSLLVLLIGIFTRHEAIKQTSYALFIITAFLALPTRNSGENAEHSIEKLIKVDDAAIEKHEEMSNIGFWTAIITGLVSVIALFLSFKGNDLRGVLSIVVLVVAIVSIYFLWQTGETGGKIRHTETFEAPV